MFANGTGQLRLTVNLGFDGEPTWSPDGTRIAFASYRNKTKSYLGDVFDGSGQTQISDLPYSENPTWSPVRDSIAF